nr:FRG domain-containing protein [Hymenobacter sp. BRD67]
MPSSPPPTANDFEAQSWQHLQDLLFHETWDARLGRYRSPFVYRGMRSFGYTLSTSLQRLGGNYHLLEHHLLRNFRKYARDTTTPPAPRSGTGWPWLSTTACPRGCSTGPTRPT